MAKERFAEMDVFKGVLIVLVVVGHLIPQFIAEADCLGMRVAFFAIYGFHMQAFAFIAGFCVSWLPEMPDAVADGAFFRRRAERLLLPYLVWGGLYFLARLAVPSLSAEGYDFARAWQFLIGYNPDGALWFLWALFFATLVVRVGLRFASPGRLTAAAVLTCVLALWTQPWLSLPVAVNALPLFALFFALGLLVRRRYARIRVLLAKPALGVGILAAWCLVQVLHPWTVTEIPWYLPGVTSVLGTGAFLFLSIRLSDSALRLKAPLVSLSAYAMEIFILAEPVKVVCRAVLRRLGTPVPVAFLVMFVLMLAMPVVLTRHVLRKPWLRLLLLGRR